MSANISLTLLFSAQVLFIRQSKSIRETLSKWKAGVARLGLAGQVSRVRLRQALSSWLVRMLLYTVSGQQSFVPPLFHQADLASNRWTGPSLLPAWRLIGATRDFFYSSKNCKDYGNNVCWHKESVFLSLVSN
jgi:hypothetical protein